MTRQAIFSHCQKYRYTLWRQVSDVFEPGQGVFNVLALNPSTATDSIDDPTIRRCTRFAKDLGYAEYCMTNLFGFRATNPLDMLDQSDPIGPDNNHWITEIAKESRIIICAWGVHGESRGRYLEVMKLLTPHQSKVHCLDLNRDGSPKHPLYIAAHIKPKPFGVIY